MKNTFNNMLEHPIATVFIIGTITSGIADIINAARGKELKPRFTVEIGSKPKKESK